MDVQLFKTSFVVGNHWGNGPLRGLSGPIRPPLKVRRRVNNGSRLKPGSCSALHIDRATSYLSFVHQSILWDRGLCHYSDPQALHQPCVVCPRFLNHMKDCSEDIRPPCVLGRGPRRQLLPQGQNHTTLALSAATTHTSGDLRSGIQASDWTTAKRSAAVVPFVLSNPIKASPGPSIHSTPPINMGSGVPTPTTSVHIDTTLERKEVTESDGLAEPSGAPGLADICSAPEGLDQNVSPIPSASELGSLSDFSRPPSSQFSRSTDLSSGRSSALSANLREVNSRCSTSLSQLRSSSLSTRSSCLPQTSLFAQSNTSPPHQPMLGSQTKQCPLDRGTFHFSNTPVDRPPSSYPDQQQDTAMDPHLEQELYPDHDMAAPSDPWPSCPSPNRISEEGMGLGLNPSPVPGRQDWTSGRWAVLPPISPARGDSDRGISRCSEISCNQSQMFDELNAIAPRSDSCPSLDHQLSSADSPSPDTVLSPGLAALTVGCDSGNLGSLSRVHLLLLDRPETEEFLCFSGQEPYSPSSDWTRDNLSPYSRGSASAGVLSLLTAGSRGDSRVSAECDSTGKVHRHRVHKVNSSERDSRSPALSMDSSLSETGFKFLDAEQGDPTQEQLGRRRTSSGERNRSARLEQKMKEKEWRMEEKKTKVLHIFSKLQESRPPYQQSNSKSHSKFEDFDFLAKYCIFSQEKLAEYKRAFELVDSDDDGYISCFQVLLALKNIIPPELLSEDEEIYVYRILEMVDFRVTDGLTDLRLFAVIASLAQKIATMDEFMRSLISKMDFSSLELRLYKAKQLFLFLLEAQTGGTVAQEGSISAEQLLVELKAGGICQEHEAAIQWQLQQLRSLDLLDFLAYLPLFILIHKSVITNPLDNCSYF